MSKSRMIKMVLGGIAAVVVAGQQASAANNWSGAYKRDVDLWNSGDLLEHTYFCLNPSQQTNPGDQTDCFSITGWGSTSTKSWGAYLANTGKQKSTHQRCLARSRASNSLASGCGFFSELYAINGVCHQHTNRGQMSMHGTFVDPGLIGGGWLSYFLYGPYGISYPACFAWSEGACAFTW